MARARWCCGGVPERSGSISIDRDMRGREVKLAGSAPYFASSAPFRRCGGAGGGGSGGLRNYTDEAVGYEADHTDHTDDAHYEASESRIGICDCRMGDRREPPTGV
jgi:hypothetical protein